MFVVLPVGLITLSTRIKRMKNICFSTQRISLLPASAGLIDLLKKRFMIDRCVYVCIGLFLNFESERLYFVKQLFFLFFG